MVVCKDAFDVIKMCCPFEEQKEIYVDSLGRLRIPFNNKDIHQHEIEYIENKFGCKNVSFVGDENQHELAIKIRNDSVTFD